MQHLTNPSVCAACVAFTEMLGLDSTLLRVDIEAASRVLAHAGLEDLLGDDAKEESTMEDAIGMCSVHVIKISRYDSICTCSNVVYSVLRLQQSTLIIGGLPLILACTALHVISFCRALVQLF